MAYEYENLTFDYNFLAADNEFEALEDQRLSLVLFILLWSCLLSWWSSMHVDLTLQRQMAKNCYYS